MKIADLLNELSFQGSPCTSNCSGHNAGYKWNLKFHGNAPCQSTSPSFNKGCQIAATQTANNRIVRPKVRDDKGKFTMNPRGRAK